MIAKHKYQLIQVTLETLLVVNLNAVVEIGYTKKLFASAISGLMLLWIDEKIDWLLPASGKQGRSERFSDATIQFYLMVKNLFGLALRQATGIVACLLKLSCLDWPVLDYTMLCHRQQRLQVCVSYRPNPNGLHLLVNSTAIKMLGEGEWKTKKYGAEHHRQWRRLT